MYGIPKYKPQFFLKAKSFLGIHGESLRSLTGKTIDDYWLMWMIDLNEWFADGPIILKIDGQQFEFTTNGFDEISLTIDQIDLNQNIDRLDFGDELITLTWESKCNSDIDQIIGLPIKEISLLTYKEKTAVLKDSTNPKYVKSVNDRGYILKGIQFDFNYNRNTKHLGILSSMGANVMVSKPLIKDYKTIIIK
jgi:hypothetical protein